MVYTGQAVLCKRFAVLFCDGAVPGEAAPYLFLSVSAILGVIQNFSQKSEEASCLREVKDWISQRDGQASSGVWEE